MSWSETFNDGSPNLLPPPNLARAIEDAWRWELEPELQSDLIGGGYRQSDNIVVPSAPQSPIVATAGNAQISTTFGVPASNGGSAITGYLATAYINGVSTGISQTGTSSPIVITGLANGITYTVEVQAENVVGYGQSSAPSNPVTPSAGAYGPYDPRAYIIE